MLTDLGRMKQAEEAFNAASLGERQRRGEHQPRRHGPPERRRRRCSIVLQQSQRRCELSYNKGVLAIAQGDYGRAISSMGGSTIELGLGQDLNGDANGARTTLQNSDSDSAIADYLLAVCAARLDDAAGVRKHIRAAIDKDASLRNRALSDLEFRNHKESLIN